MKAKRSWLALSAALALALTACSSGGEEDPTSGGGATSGDTGTSATSAGIVTANGSEPQNPLIPADTNEVGGGRIISMLFSGLVSFDADGEPQNEMAESIESEDNKTWTIKLKEGQKFTDGTEVQAHNFTEAWQQAADNAYQSSSFFGHIEGANEDGTGELTGLKVVDDYTFTVTLKDAESDFPIQVGYNAFSPLPDSTLADPETGGQVPVGNGPYMLASDTAWQHNVQIDLVPNPDYQGPRQVKNGGLTLKFYTSADSAYADLQSNNLDVMDQMPSSALANFTSDLGERAVNQPAAVWQSFTIDMNAPHFSGEEGQLRRAALSYAVDRESITQTIFSGTRTPAKDFTSPTIPGYDENVPGNEVLTYDPEKAKELWAQADAISPWEGEFTLAYNSDSDHQPWVDAVCNSIKNTLGIEAVGNPYPDFKSLRDDVTNHKMTSAFRTGWQADYPSLYNFLGPLYATGASSNDAQYSNPEVDDLLLQASSAATSDEANALMEQAQEQLLKDLPAIPLWYQNLTGGYAETVSNVVFGWDSQPLYYDIVKEG